MESIKVSSDVLVIVKKRQAQIFEESKTKPSYSDVLVELLEKSPQYRKLKTGK